MKSCSVAPPEPPPFGSEERHAHILVANADCLQKLLQHYVRDPAGGGYGGVVILIDRATEKRIVCKVIPYALTDNDASPERKYVLQNQIARDVSEEVSITCQLNALKPRTHVFIHGLGWLLCKHYPTDWPLDYETESMDSPYYHTTIRSYMFLFMERADYRFSTAARKLRLSHADAKALLFLLMHGLWVARTELGFVHGDLHPENVMLSFHLPADDEVREVAILGQRFSIPLPSRLSPKIIDFGTSRTSSIVRQGFRQPDNDARSLIHRCFAVQFPGLFTEAQLADWKAQGLFEHDNAAAMARFLLDDPLFEAVRRPPPIGAAVPQKCVFCGRGARQQWTTLDELQFCGTFCANRVRGLAHM